jgi:hypothetical protein
MLSFLRGATALAETEWGGAVSVSCGCQESTTFELQRHQSSAPRLIDVFELW